ncbi:MAG: AarF/ABC1/UbiB kinase family protein [Cyanobacteria bacterium P01_F01_bin.150]
MSHQSLEKIKRYDAKAIARYYYLRPWLAVWRGISVVWQFAGFIIGLKVNRWFEGDRSQENSQSGAQSCNRSAEQLRKILTRLGPTFIKVGQALSTRPDLIRADFLDELIKLQDQLPPFPTEQAYALIERELDDNIEDLFSSIARQPVAAASLGQVYEARLLSGEAVAVKVQRPGLLPIITLDLFLMRWAAGWMAPFLPLNLGHDLQLIVDEFGTKLFEEIDYINEGRNAERFATNFQNDPRVKVPSIFWRYSNTHVLTLEWIDGFKLTDIDRIKQENLEVDDLIEIGVTAGLQQLLEFGFFHADPHPGNLFAMPDGRMAYIDFGMMDQLSQAMKETLVDSLVHLINKDYDRLADDFVKLGFLTPETDITPIIPALETVFDNAIGESVEDFNFQTITDSFSELMFDYPFRVPAKFALIIRSLITQEGLALTLNPAFKIVEVGYPYVARRLLTEETPEFRQRLLEVLFKGGKFQWERLENLIAIARTNASFDLLPSAQMGLQYVMSEEGEHIRRQVMLSLVENDRLHIEQVGRIWDLVKPELQPDRLFNTAVSAIGSFSSQQATGLLPALAGLAGFQGTNENRKQA